MILDRLRVGGVVALLALAAPLPAPAQPGGWGTVADPAAGAPESIGGTSLGCLRGAAALPADGPGWQAVRTSRNRFWGHPVLLDAVRTLAARASAAGLPDLWIGDMSQPRGGPMAYGHASHQTGLDVDVWLDLRAKPRVPASARERIEVPSLVTPDEAGADPARFTPAHARLIRLAAELPGVNRVLVNHGIKRTLCRMHPGEPWLRMVRPWRGHDSHMHIRLRCPIGSPECRDIAPPPPGDGCDASLAWWLSPDARRPPAATPGPAPRMPASCAGVLGAP